MTLVVAMDELPPHQVDQLGTVGPGNPGCLRTTFFKATSEQPIAPTAKFNRYPAGESRYSATHFHEIDQFQVIMEGKGEFGRHHVAPYYVHFSRAYTPYGPLQSDKDGWAFMVFQTRHDIGAQRFPESAAKLKQVPNRRPWQISVKVDFPETRSGVAIHEIPEVKDEHGLFMQTMTMAPSAEATAPNPSGGDGQYVLVVKGSLVYEDKERKAPAVVFVKPDESAFKIRAGGQGLQAIIMNFPQVTAQPVEAKKPAVVSEYQKWQCELCAFAYDEAVGLPADGIPAGTRWEDVPETWTCPDCGASKSDFQMTAVVLGNSWVQAVTPSMRE